MQQIDTYTLSVSLFIFFLKKVSLEEWRPNNWLPSELINDADFNSFLQ